MERKERRGEREEEEESEGREGGRRERGEWEFHSHHNTIQRERRLRSYTVSSW